MPRTSFVKQAAVIVLWSCFSLGLLNTAFFDLPLRIQRHYDFTKDYGITEWLINYQAGFVRRGLAGEVLHSLWKAVGFNPVWLVLSLSIFLFIVYGIYILSLSRGLVHRWLPPSALLLGFPLYTGNLIRKDIALILLAALMYLLLPRIRGSLWFCILLNTLTCFGLLLHEMFLFIWFAPFVNLLRLRLNGFSMVSPVGCLPVRRHAFLSFCALLCRSVLLLFPSLLIFSVIGKLAATGNPEAAYIVHQSWSGLWSADAPFPLAPGGSIMWLGRQGESTVEAILTAHSVPYLIPSFLWIMVLVGFSFVLALAAVPRSLRSSLVSWLALQCLCVSPLFIIAYDAGRWIFLIFASAFIFALQDVRFRPGSQIRFLAGNHALGWLMDPSSSLASVVSALSPVLLLFIGFPVATWSPPEFVASIPLYQIWLFGKNIGLFPALGSLLYR